MSKIDDTQIAPERYGVDFRFESPLEKKAKTNLRKLLKKPEPQTRQKERRTYILRVRGKIQ